ncbi:protocatechuate 3,4-dioxygenase [Ramlibacter sp. PS4R-6]|uniref:protocatechuate 3,4-dioxygenase n=1 Tax=Ramlibacter sp. PS4R-6 TaxID=3133438 RepID=UPI0030A296F4
MDPSALTRRSAAAFVAFPWIWSAARAQPIAPRRTTPSQTEGPFYPVELPADSDFDLLRNGNLTYARGQPAWVEGTVRDLEGRPVRGAAVEIWQCDEAGHYHHPGDRGADAAFQGFGRVTTDASGAWRFRTIKPAPYSGRTPHIHFKVKLGSRELLTTQMYVAGDPHNERDGLWRSLDAADRAALTRNFVAGSDGVKADFPIIVKT